MIENSTCPQLTALEEELNNLTILRELEMTKVDYDKLMSIKNRLRNLVEQEGVVLSVEDDNYRQYLMMDAYKVLNVMEDFYENNGHKWK